MFDQILSSLQKEAAPALMAKLGLDQNQADKSVGAAANSVKEVLGGNHGFGMDDVLSLFSNNTNTAGANGLMSKLGTVMQGKLSTEAGLPAEKASMVQSMLLPLVTDFIAKHVGGDASKLKGMLGGLGDLSGMADTAKGMLGKLFK
ncbi:MAG: hypothetical protein IPN44_02780 [Flavobacteriales bacterium]|nr:hypothetical protein [Flavobacteriales bacterium]